MDPKSRIEKCKFSHSTKKLMYFETFIREETVYYVLQDEAKDTFIGKANGAFSIVSRSILQDRISNIGYVPASNMLYLSSTKGHLYSWKLSEGDHEPERTSSADGKQIIGMLCYHSPTDKVDTVITFTEQGKMRKIVQNKIVSTLSFPQRIEKVLSAKAPSNQQDILCTIFTGGIKFPFIFSLQDILKMIESEQALREYLNKYEQAMQYDADQQIREAPRIAALSDSSPILVMADKKVITVFVIDKKEDNGFFFVQPDFKFESEEDIIEIDLLGDSLIYISQRGISSYNLEKRNTISKNLLFKGYNEYNLIRWANWKSQIIYGSSLANNMKLLFAILNVK